MVNSFASLGELSGEAKQRALAMNISNGLYIVATAILACAQYCGFLLVSSIVLSFTRKKIARQEIEACEAIDAKLVS